MKIRNGFVSNSSSSSFTIISKKELNYKLLWNVLGVPEEHPLYNIVGNICSCILERAKKVDEHDLEKSIEKWNEQFDKDKLKTIKDGNYLYECIFSSESYGIETFLYENSFDVKLDGFEIISDG